MAASTVAAGLPDYLRAAARRAGLAARPPALVLGGIDLVRALGVGDIASVVVAQPIDPGCYSRSAVARLESRGPVRGSDDRLLEYLLEFGASSGARLPLFYDNDFDLLFASRRRVALGERFGLALADEALVEALLDKGRFQALAEERSLPVPPALRVPPERLGAPVDLAFPVVVKPLTRHPESWGPVSGGKAVLMRDAAELARLGERLAGSGLELLVQEHVPGPETRIESYHVYRDHQGGLAAEFTGRKLRTRPAAFGFSTAVEITAVADVAELGRELVERINLTGAAKLDFKRAPDGRLWLLEVNPRYSLWHHPGAVAGVNIPAIVYADLVGIRRPTAGPIRAGVRWTHLVHDPRAARDDGMSPLAWARWAVGCEAKHGFARDDPLPLARALRRRLADRLLGG